jgi:hypothetical protein
MHSSSRPSIRRFTGFSLARATILAGGAAAGIIALGSSSPASAVAPGTTAVLGSPSFTAAGGTAGPQVPCGSAGNCTAAGYYTGAASVEAFVADERKGTWGAAREVAGSLNTDGLADIASVSCATAASCSAGGFYTVLDRAKDNAYEQAFVVNKT